MAEKNNSAVITVKFDQNSNEAMKALEYLKTFKRKQGRFITALILWYMSHDELQFDKETERIVDINNIMSQLNDYGIEYSTLGYIKENFATIKEAISFMNKYGISAEILCESSLVSENKDGDNVLPVGVDGKVEMAESSEFISPANDISGIDVKRDSHIRDESTDLADDDDDDDAWMLQLSDF